jgi:hypothetical protein
MDYKCIHLQIGTADVNSLSQVPPSRNRAQIGGQWSCAAEVERLSRRSVVAN